MLIELQLKPRQIWEWKMLWRENKYKAGKLVTHSRVWFTRLAHVRLSLINKAHITPLGLLP